MAAALPYFIDAFEREGIPQRRARLVRIIWQFREQAALPTLAIALRDSSGDVWKDALDGIVTLGGRQALTILETMRMELSGRAAEIEKIEWIDEAASQVAERIG